MNIQEYIKAIDEQFQTGIAREHSYRPALQQLLADMLPNYVVTNEPAHFECGAPDYIISQKNGAKQPVFFVEAKDLFDNDLDGVRQHKEQFNRYKSSLDYIIFTDYLDFHVYEHGEWVKNIRIGEQQGKHIGLVKDAEEEFVALVKHLADSKPTPITSASKLAEQMASKARLLADVIKNAFKNSENTNTEYYHENAQLDAQLQAFRNILIHDLTPEGFADLYAQTIAYGMFAARLHDDTPEDFSRTEAATLIPKTNPFLRQIFQQIAGYDLDERIAWIVDDLAQTFLVTDVEKVMKTYGENVLHNDPMIHFYEDFLAAYDSKLRKARGVWYTPQPVVNFIIRSIDDILKQDFNLPMGLADYSKIKHEVKNDQWNSKSKSAKTYLQETHRVQILDPATGTGTFLAEIVRQIYGKFQGMQGMWQSYVEEHLLPRLYGFEILMASYAVAHLKLDLQLRNLGYDSEKAKNQRFRVYLTNSLEESHPDTGTLWSQWLSTEANEANRVKRDCPVMVMVGNPPYSGISQNNGEWIVNLVGDYKYEPNTNLPLKERKTWINDDYVKFIRLCEYYIDRNGSGIFGFINNNGFLDNPTFRGMRWHLLNSFDKIYVLNLHGNSSKKETCPNGDKDENVFDITVGTSINIFVKNGKSYGQGLAKVFYKDVYGLRNDKYDYLIKNSLDNIAFEEIKLSEPYYFFRPSEEKWKSEYEQGIRIDELMPVNVMGITTARDAFVVDKSASDLLKRITQFADLNISDEQTRQTFFGHKKAGKYLPGDSRGWNMIEARRKIQNRDHLNMIKPISYRIFDTQYIYYSPDVVDWGREQVMTNLLSPNLGLCCVRINSREEHTYYITNNIVDKTILSSKDNANVFPLYIYTDGVLEEKRIPNLNSTEWKKFDNAIGRHTEPEEIMSYIYGVLYSKRFREKYKQYLKVDFPRIPLPKDEEEFKLYTSAGKELSDLHLMNNYSSWRITSNYNETGNNKVEDISFKDGCVWINNQQFFGNISETAWNSHIGGYQPAQKWLKDRKGCTLSFDDIQHYMRIIYVLDETDRIMKEIG